MRRGLYTWHMYVGCRLKRELETLQMSALGVAEKRYSAVLSRVRLHSSQMFPSAVPRVCCCCHQAGLYSRSCGAGSLILCRRGPVFFSACDGLFVCVFIYGSHDGAIGVLIYLPEGGLCRNESWPRVDRVGGKGGTAVFLHQPHADVAAL